MTPVEALVARSKTAPQLRKAVIVGLNTVGALMILTFVFANDSRHYHLHEIFELNAGEALALPPIVYQGIRLVRVHGLTSVALSPSVSADVEVFQRYVEGMYPIRVDSQSKYVLVGRADQVDPKCRVIGQDRLVALQRCQ